MAHLTDNRADDRHALHPSRAIARGWRSIGARGQSRGSWSCAHWHWPWRSSARPQPRLRHPSRHKTLRRWAAIRSPQPDPWCSWSTRPPASCGKPPGVRIGRRQSTRSSRRNSLTRLEPGFRGAPRQPPPIARQVRCALAVGTAIARQFDHAVGSRRASTESPIDPNGRRESSFGLHAMQAGIAKIRSIAAALLLNVQ